MLNDLFQYILHLDKELPKLVDRFGIWVYVILFGVIFAETAFVIFPFLPGDSLLFVTGIVSATKENNVHFGVMFAVLTSAAIAGNVMNYWIGKLFGARLFSNPKSKIFSQSNKAKTEEFFDHYGGKTIIITRFVPVVRAFAPFIAGMGAMEFPKFMIYNVISAVMWVGICMFAGFFLGNISPFKERFELMLVAIVALSVIPVAIEIIAHKVRSNKAKNEAAKVETNAVEATQPENS